MRQYVIVGNGIAGVTAAQSIVRADSGAEVHILGAEPYPYYQRPRLWEFLAGEIEQQALYFRPPEWYADKGIHMRLGARVTALSLSEHRLTLDNGESDNYDRLLIATGARPFVPLCEGTDKEGVFSLRTLDDALAIKAYSPPLFPPAGGGDEGGAIIVGGGLLGLETARALRSAGLNVTVVEFSPYLMTRQLDAEGAQVLQSLLEAQGLRIITSAVTEAVLGGKRAAGIRLRDGREVSGELVLFSTGIRSEVALARTAGLEVNQGVVVDRQLQTSAEDVFAAGDAAEFGGRVYGIIPAAIEQARAAAANMVSAGSVVYNGTVPSTTLKVVGIDLTCLGDATADGDEFVILRHKTADLYKRLALRDGVIVGAILMGDKQSVQPLKQLITSGRDVSAYTERLLNENFNLKALARGQSPD